MTDTTPESQGAPEAQAAPEAQQTVPSPVEQPGAWPEPQGATPGDQAAAPDAGATPESEPQPTNADGTAIPTPDAAPDATVAAPEPEVPTPGAMLDPTALDPAPETPEVETPGAAEPEQPVQNLSQQAPDADPNPAFHGEEAAAPEIEHPTHEAYSPDPAPGTVV